MNKKIFFVIGLCLLTITGCGKVPKLQNGQEVVASIDGFDLTAEDLFEDLKEKYGIALVVDGIDTAIADKEITDTKEADEHAKEEIDKLKAQYEMYGMDFNEALISNGYKNEAELTKVIASDYKKELVLTNFLEKKLTEEEINKYYEEEIFGEMTVRHILITPDVTNDMTDDEKKDAEAKALDKAKDLIKKLNEGADFAELAKEHSDDAGTASEGGLFANFTKEGVVEEFFDASLKLENDKYTTTPVKTTYGYHVILKVSQNEKPKLDDVIDTIKETLVKKQLTENANLSITAWDEIRKSYNMVINDSNIKENYDTVINSYKN